MFCHGYDSHVYFLNPAASSAMASSFFTVMGAVLALSNFLSEEEEEGRKERREEEEGERKKEGRTVDTMALYSCCGGGITNQSRLSRAPAPSDPASPPHHLLAG